MADVPAPSFADPAVATCPFAAYAALRPQQPVYHDPLTGLYEVLGAAEIREAASDVATFSNLIDRPAGDDELEHEIAAVYRTGFAPMPTLLNNDGEDHRRFRSLVDRAFTLPRITALTPAIAAETEQLLDACGTGAIEFVERFAVPLPLNVIADQLGVDRGDHAVFKRGSDAMIAVSDPLTPRTALVDHVRAIVAMQHLLAARIDRVRTAPDDTILSVVANGDVDGARLPIGDVVNLFQNILVAGNETTTNALGNMLEQLIARPKLADRLRADASAVRPFVEELLRLRAPLQGFFRVVTRDTELGGVAIPAGARVMLRWGAGGLDPTGYPDPDALDLDRRAITQHLTFGHGAHFCIGNQLARAELRIACAAILSRWRTIALAGPDAIDRPPLFFVHGVKAMRIVVS